MIYWLAAIVFIGIFGGALLGVFAQSWLPRDHLEPESKDAVELVMGMVATMVALLLGLLVSSAHSFYASQRIEVQQLCANTLLLDQMLERYGPQAQPARQILRDSVAATIKAMLLGEGVNSANTRPDGMVAGAPGMFGQVESLVPANAAQRFTQSEALALMTSIATSRLMFREEAYTGVPSVMLAVMIAWLIALFTGFGLLARKNATVIAALGTSALSVTAAVFLIVAMNDPYTGLMRLSLTPLQDVLTQLEQ